jgi:hypothetical protein
MSRGSRNPDAPTGLDDIRIVFSVVPMDTLPAPRHLRWPCAFESEHVRLVSALGDTQLAFQRFLEDVRPRLHECEYHRADWQLAADAATLACESSPVSGGRELADELSAEAERIARAGGADDATIDMIRALFDHPVQVVNRGRSLQNGQRRVCALTAAGVGRCPVLVDVPRIH